MKVALEPVEVEVEEETEVEVEVVVLLNGGADDPELEVESTPPTGPKGGTVLVLAFLARATKASIVFPTEGL